jgi:hypothetical protein
MTYSRLRLLLCSLDTQTFRSLPHKVGLKTATGALSEGLVERDGEMRSGARYRLTTAGNALKQQFGSIRTKADQ